MIEIKCDISDESVEFIEAFLCEYVRSNWTIFNVRAGEPYLLRGYFEDKAEGLESYRELKAEFDFLPVEPTLVELDGKEWKEAYKEFIQPWSSRGLHWVPVWKRDEYVVPEGEKVVYLDAGMAFGTGSHETTRLMARRLLDFCETCDADLFAAAKVVDAGCGSGILAISASLLGFKNVYGFDRDPEAYRVSVENESFNGLAAGTIEFKEAGLEEGLEGRTIDFMMANIQADVLKIHAEGILKSMNLDGGVLALSGILSKEVDEVREHFERLANTVYPSFKSDVRVDGEWSDLCFFIGA